MLKIVAITAICLLAKTDAIKVNVLYPAEYPVKETYQYGHTQDRSPFLKLGGEKLLTTLWSGVPQILKDESHKSEDLIPEESMMQKIYEDMSDDQWKELPESDDTVTVKFERSSTADFWMIDIPRSQL